MKKLPLGIFLGAIAGILDVIPMLIKNMPRVAIISSFVFRCITGFIIGTSALNVKGIGKGAIISGLLIIPLLIIIGRNDQDELIPIFIITLMLGGFLGFLISRYGK